MDACPLGAFPKLEDTQFVTQASETSELSPGDIPASLDAGHPRLVLGSSAPEKVMQHQKTLKGELGTSTNNRV